MSRYHVTLTVEYEAGDLETHNDAMKIIGTTLPYMMDNVFIKSHLTDHHLETSWKE